MIFLPYEAPADLPPLDLAAPYAEQGCIPTRWVNFFKYNNLVIIRGEKAREIKENKLHVIQRGRLRVNSLLVKRLKDKQKKQI